MSEEFFKTKEILSPIEHWGRWSIPQNGKFSEELAGLLKFQTNSAGQLTICGNFKDTPLQTMKSYPALWGKISDFKGISVFDAFVTHINPLDIQGDQPVTLAFSEYWDGNVWFSGREDVKFKSVSFGINNLEMWHNDSNFESSCGRHLKNIKLKYSRPANVDLFEDENVKVSLGYNVGGPGSCYGQTVASIKQSARILIKSKRGRLLPFYGAADSFQYYIEMFFCFLSLLIGKNTFIYDIYGTLKPIKIKNGKIISQEIYATRFWRQSIAESHLKDLCFLDVALPYWQTKDRLKEAIRQYNIYHQKISKHVFELIRYQNYSNKIDHHILPQFVFVFEGLVRVLHDDEVKAYHKEKVLTDEYEIMRNSILEQCDDKQKTWLNSKLPQYPKLREYYDVVLNSIGELFPYLLEKKYGDDSSALSDYIFKYLKKERNGLAHATKRTESDIHLYISVLQWLHLVLTLAIWKKCGISTEILQERLKKHHAVYNSIKETICSLLPTWINQ